MLSASIINKPVVQDQGLSMVNVEK